ncbi:MAG: hypothetical protein KF797_15165, partial [Flavobacteriales bacterium]|nr:hypothetical protein [Flavobacteriales bacterium]
LCFQGGILVVCLCTFLLVYNDIGHGLLVRMFKMGALQLDAMLRSYNGRSLFVGDALARAQAEADASDAMLPALALATLLLPGLLLSAVVFSRRFEPWFSGLRGYLRALTTAALVVPASLFISNYIMALLALWADPYTVSGRQLWPGGLVAGLTLIGFALIGGLAGTVVLYSAFRVRYGRNTPVDLGTAFGTSFLGLLAYGIAVAAGLILYREGDPLVAWLHQVADAPSSLSAALHNLTGWFGTLPGFLAVQIPALLCCAGVVSWRIGRPFDGVRGFLYAALVCLPVVVVLVMPAIAIVVHTVAALPTGDPRF